MDAAQPACHSAEPLPNHPAPFLSNIKNPIHYHKNNYTESKHPLPVKTMKKGRQLLGGLASAFWFPLAALANAGSSETDVKAAFIYNFTKFVEWPATALAPDAPMQICVMGKNDLGDRLRQLHGREAQGHPLQVRILVPADNQADCHVIFITRESARQLPQLLKPFTNNAILTVSDAPDFIRNGGMIELFVESSRVQFIINLDSAQQAGLKISARMLQLARIPRPGGK